MAGCSSLVFHQYTMVFVKGQMFLPEEQEKEVCSSEQTSFYQV